MPFANRTLAASLGLVGYVFAGYPALMAAWARLRPAPVAADPDARPPLSLVVVAYDEADVIDDKLRNVAALDYPRDRLEVIVVSDGSQDDTPQRAGRHPGVRVLHRPERRGKLAAMTRAAALAEHDLLVFSDANNHYSPDALQAIAACFADPAVGVVTGQKMIDDGSGRALDRTEGIYWRYEALLKAWESRVGSVIGVAGEILAFRREAFPEVPAGTLNEDFVQAMLAASDGWRIAYAPDALSLERASATVDDEVSRRSRLVAGRFQAMARMLPRLATRQPLLAWQMLSHKGLRPVVPWALPVAAVSSLRAAPAARWARAVAVAQLAFYAAAALGWRDARRDRRRLWTYAPYYFCRMNAASLRGLRRFASGGQSHVWERTRRA